MNFYKSLSSVFLLLVFLVSSANAAKIQVIEADGSSSDRIEKKLRAMGTVYLAELGHQPSPDFERIGVSFSTTGPGKNIIRMEKFTSDGIIELDSTAVVDMDDMDNDLETLITKNFSYADKPYSRDSITEVFFGDPEFIDVSDSLGSIVSRLTEASIEDDLGMTLSENNRGVQLYTTLIKLKNSYWLGMLRQKGSKVIKASHKKIAKDEDLYYAILSLLYRVMSPNEPPKNMDTDEAEPSKGTHAELCRVVEEAESLSGAVGALTFDLLCYVSDYTGLETSIGVKDLYGDFAPNIRLGFTFGFSDTHSWIFGVDLGGPTPNSDYRLAVESTHRFSQDKGFFADIIWGYGFDRYKEGWYIGADIGYNLLVSHSKDHWLSLMLRYDATFESDWLADGRISLNLVYNLRAYFDD